MAKKQVQGEKEPEEYRVDDPKQAWANFEATLHKAITTPKREFATRKDRSSKSKAGKTEETKG